MQQLGHKALVLGREVHGGALAEVLPRATESQHVERVGFVQKHLANLGLRPSVRHLRPLHALDCVSARAPAVARRRAG